MSLTIHSKYRYFDFTAQRAEDRRQKFHFCCLPFAVNVMLNLSINNNTKDFRLKDHVSVAFLSCDMTFRRRTPKLSLFPRDV